MQPLAGSTVDAVASALVEADAVAAKIQQLFGETAELAGTRAIAAVLHERQHGGTFNELAKLFAADGASFSRPTLRKWRALVADLDRPEAFVQRLELEEARRQRNADNNAAFRAGSAMPRFRSESARAAQAHT